MKRLRPVFVSGLAFIIATLLWAGDGERLLAQSGAIRRVKIIAFIDLSDSYTKRFFQSTYRAIKQTYADRVEFVLRHAPRPRSAGETLAEAVYCAGDQFRQWDYVEALASGNFSGDQQVLIGLASQLRMNTASFSECLAKGKKRPFVEADLKEAGNVGLRGTPVFYVHGEYIEGVAGFSAFRPIIDRVLQASTRSPIKIQIVYNSQFPLDDPHKFYAYLNTYFFPESEFSLISHSSSEGQKLMKASGARWLPAVLFGREIEISNKFSQFQDELERRNGAFVLKPSGYTGIVEFLDAPPAGNYPVKGNAKAPITITEFSDFECPACGEFVRNTLPKITERYIKPGQARLVFRNYPLTGLHPNAEGAAMAAECAAKAGIFWSYHDQLFANAKNLETASLIKYAESLGQDGKIFGQCLRASETRKQVHQDIQDGTKFGVRSTPTLLINKYRVSGSDSNSVHAVINYLLKKNSDKPAVESSRK
ncbi:MAG: thioredoxin domain-containing protein [Acidobacteria bacterium]|nr:thioredoxin domain-containing protein [Acidobacteriota bacterium]MBI3655902.1 thioredoxin domain-containing protein [Acidobacteriota bacterium]